MHHQDNPEGVCLPPSAEDRQIETTILAFIFDQHPAHLTAAELSLALSHGREDFATEDDIERAIRELVGAGLLRFIGEVVLPTRAALYFDGLGVD
jgi:hypothetical protein